MATHTPIMFLLNEVFPHRPFWHTQLFPFQQKAILQGKLNKLTMEMVFKITTYLICLYKVSVFTIQILELFNPYALQLYLLNKQQPPTQGINHLVIEPLLMLYGKGVGLQGLHRLDMSKAKLLLGVDET